MLLLLALSSAVPALAAESLDYVTDDAYILTDSELRKLNEYADSVSEQYGCGIYIVTIDDYREFSSSSVRDCAEDIYAYYELGLGYERNGIMLLLSMADCDYALIAYGEFANSAFTDYGKDVLAGALLDDFSYDDWYNGFDDYIENSADLLKSAVNGTPLDVHSGNRLTIMSMIIALIIGCIVALIVCSALKGRMKTAKLKKSAVEYITASGLQLSFASEHFTHITEVREPINNSSSSGGGTSVNHNGFSGKSGKF